ncbi:MAG: TetR/AcrR family transcriptional regulator [Proteobacteria bacterium]|nr:TetR/AcrR family transcriptional regulator [Pseudomonadota bacterium]
MSSRAPSRRRPGVRRDPEDKRERLAAAARTLFAERGFASTTTADIAAAAGVSEGLLFHHFGSKRRLFAHLAGAYGRGLAEAMFGEDPSQSTATSERALEAAFRYVREHQDEHRLFLVRDPELAELVHAETREAIVGALEKAFRVGLERGELRPLEPRIVAELMYHLVGGALEECFASGQGEREDAYLREVVRCVVGAIAPRSEHGSARSQEVSA